MMLLDGKKLMEARLNAGLSRPELSQKMGIPVRNIENWELGAKQLYKIDVIHALAATIGCLPGELYADEIVADVKDLFVKKFVTFS